MSENKHMKNKLVNTTLTASIILTAVIIGSTLGAAQITVDTKKSTDINVTVNQEVALDVDPKTLSYSNVNVGEQVTTSDRDYRGITVENTGSEYIDKIWVNASTPSQRPFGSGIPTRYDAGNFMQVKLNTTDAGVDGAIVDKYYFINRQEFEVPESSLPAYIVAPEDQVTLPNQGTVASNSGDVKVGRFRRGNEELWFIIATAEDDSSDNCDGTTGEDSMLRIANVSSTPSRLGTVDFTDDNNGGWKEYNIDEFGSTMYGISEQSIPLEYSTETLNYDILTSCDNSMNTVRTKFAVDVFDTNDLTTSGSETEFLVNAGTTPGNMLLPGSTLPIQTAVQVPTGVAAGEVTQGKLTLFATANVSAQK